MEQSVDRRIRFLGYAIVALAVTIGSLMLNTVARGHSQTECDEIRAQVADRQLLLTAAEQAGGLSSADRQQIQRERNINAAALRHCATSVPSSPPVSPTSSPTGSPTASASPSVTPTDPPAGAWPNPANTGVPAGWVPTSTRTTDLTVTVAGSVVEDIRLINADIIVQAANVTIRRVELQGGRIYNDSGSTCAAGLTIEDTSLIRAPGQTTRATDPSAVGIGSYVARRVKIDGLPEGFRVGGAGSGCGPVTIADSFMRIVRPDICGDWHGDGIQGYDGPALTATRNTIELVETGCGGTAPFFYPSGQGNTSANVDGMLVKGGGYAFRLGMSGSVTDLRIVDGSWGFGPIDVKCSALSSWSASRVTIDSNYQTTGTVATQPCNTEGGS